VKIIKHNDFTSAIAIVKSGGVVVYPTDTVWGIGGDAGNAGTVARVNSAKQHPKDKKMIWLLPSIKAVKNHFPNLTYKEQKLLFQKHTTVVIEDTSVRLAHRGWLHKFVSKCGCPIISTSANLHGQPTVKSWRGAVQVFGDTVDGIIRGPKVIKGAPSRIVKVENDEIKILRGISIK
jgi:L-threonylcarbamoyladenylate synthase